MNAVHGKGGLFSTRRRLLAIIAALATILALLPIAHFAATKVIAVGAVSYWPWIGTELCTQDYHLGYGLDFGLNHDQLYASGPGTVYSIYNSATDQPLGQNNGWGNQVIIKHAGGYYSRYSHLASVSVSEGAGVNVGAPIGISGNSGNSTAAHLHYEVYLDTTNPPHLDSAHSVEPGPISGYNNPITCEFSQGGASLTSFTNSGFGLPASGTGNVTGRVMYQYTNGESSISNITVLISAGGTTLTARTDGSGRYNFYGVPAGFAQITATVNDAPKLTDLTVVRDSTTSAQTLYYSAPQCGSTASSSMFDLFASVASAEDDCGSPPPVDPPSDGIEIVSVPPVTVNTGAQFVPSITLRVISGSINSNTDFLKATPDTDTNKFGAYPNQGLTHDVNANETYTFDANSTSQFQMTAPNQPGTYYSVWQMWSDGAFRGPRAIIQINVTGDPPAPIGWVSKYYNNPNLTGSPSWETTQDSDMFFRDWDINSPGGTINVDNWSATFEKAVSFDAGTYHFYTQHDDAAKVYVDGVEKYYLSTSGAGDWVQTLSQGNHTIRIEYHEYTGGARMELWWQGPGARALPDYQTCDSAQWCAEYWGNKTNAGNPAVRVNEGNGDLVRDWHDASPLYGLPDNNWSARYTRVVPITSGVYRFHIGYDDGVRLYIDDVLKYDNGANPAAVDIPLTDGYHVVRVDYREDTGAAFFNVVWQRISDLPPTPTLTPTPTGTPVTIQAVEDTYASSLEPNTSHGSEGAIFVEGQPATHGYLKFNLASLAGATVTSAKLRMYVTAQSAVTQYVHDTTTSWSEDTLTWNNKPTINSTVLATINSGNVINTWVEVDLTASVQAHLGSLYALGLDAVDADALGFNSSENASNPVQLVVYYTGGATPTNTPTNTPTATPTGNNGSPYGGTAWAVPGTIQAEDFNTGGQGVAYNDTDTSNNGGQYRPSEGVDISASTDSGVSGYNIGWNQVGEWLKYTINVATTGTYTFNARVASPNDNSTFHAEIDGVNVTGVMTINNTGGWGVWQTISKPGINLTAGQHILRVVFDTRSTQEAWVGDFNYFSFTADGAPTATNTPTNTPTATATPTNTPTATPTSVPSAQFVQGKLSNSTAAVSSRTVTFDSSVTTGNLIVLGVSGYAPGGNFTVSVSDNHGNTYTKAVGQGTNDFVEIWYGQNVTGGSNFIITITPSQNAYLAIGANEYSGMATASVLDKTAGSTGTGSAATSTNTATTGQANELLFGATYLAEAGPYTVTPGTGYTLRQAQSDNTYSQDLWTEDKFVSTAGAYAATFSYNTSTTYKTVIATFKTAE